MQVSPTLNLVKDYLQFVTTFFEVISTSSPHIYHSAIPLSPRSSLIWELYGSLANPLVRFVQGVPISWDLYTATYTGVIGAVTLSPCGSFIAVVPYSPEGAQILDAVTMEQLSVTCPRPQTKPRFGTLMFSPDSGSLAFYHDDPKYLVSWDLQTGGLTSSIEIDENIGLFERMIYSECGTILGLLFIEHDSYTIYTYGVLAGTPISSYSGKGQVMGIWTHNECLQYATLDQELITIWEGTFTLRQPPMVVKSLDISYGIYSSGSFVFNPTLSCIAFTFAQKVQVWNIQDSTCLLSFPVHAGYGPGLSFSSDGHFFAYIIQDGSMIYIWKETPTGYILHQQLIPNASATSPPLFSHDGKYILVQCGPTAFQLWHTEVLSIPHSDPSISSLQQSTSNFTIEFFSEGELALVTKVGNKAVQVLNLSLGISPLTIHVDMAVFAMRVVESTIFIVCPGTVFTWSIPEAGDIDSLSNIANGTLKITFEYSGELQAASISPNSHYMATITKSGLFQHLNVYDMNTGACLGSTGTNGAVIWFIPDSSSIWCSSIEGNWNWQEFIKEGQSYIKPKDQALLKDQPGGLPWNSTHSYEVTNDGWILSPSKKQLLWLPHRWRLSGATRRWSGSYFALLHYALPQAIILNLQGV